MATASRRIQQTRTYDDSIKVPGIRHRNLQAELTQVSRIGQQVGDCDIHRIQDEARIRNELFQLARYAMHS
jgi:hypothetical protein